MLAGMRATNGGQATRAVVSELWRSFGRVWKTMLAIHVLFIVLGFVVFGPLATGCTHLAVSLSGDAALSDLAIASFLLTPLGAVVALVLGSLLLALGILEYAVLLVPARAAFHDEDATWSDAFSRVAAVIPSVLRLALRLILHVLATVLPFVAAIGAIYVLLLGGNDINYYLAGKPPEFLWAAGLGACLVVTMGIMLVRLAMRWFYVLPLVVFRRESPGEARRISRETVPGRGREIFISVAIWLFGIPFLAGLVNGPLSAFGLWLAPRFADRLGVLAAALGFLGLLMAGIAFLCGFVGLSMLALQNVRLYRADGLDAEGSDAAASGRAWRLPMGAKSLWGGAVAVVVLAAVFSYHWLDRIRVPDHAVVIAHRGASAAAPENTMAAIRRAVDAGADWVEIDVQETLDGKVVVFHDSDFMRLAGREGVVWETESSQLAGIDIGSSFSGDFAGERVPSLKEVLGICRGHCGVLVELKYYGHDQQLEQRVVEIVEAAEMQDHVMVMSLEYAGIRKMRALRPDWKLGLLSTVSLGDLTKLDVNFLGLNARAASRSLVGRAHAAGLEIYVWTVNTPMDMSAMLGRGVDGLITDEPALAREVLAQRAEMNSGERLLVDLAALLGRQPDLPEQ